MSRSAIWMVCVAVLNGISGCASCNCCAPVSGCCSSGGDYAMNDGYYPMDGGNYTGGGDCGCSGGGGGGAPSSAGMGYDAVYGDTAYGDVGQSMPMASQQYRGNMGRMSAYDMQPAQQYAGYNSSPKQIPATTVSTECHAEQVCGQHSTSGYVDLGIVTPAIWGHRPAVLSTQGTV
jgi:hypothetical protein